MSYYRDIDDIVEAIKNAKRREKSCALLIGAGCSAKAGIPLARDFVEIIKTRWPSAYSRANKKTYPECMAELSAGERRDLIKEYVDSAKINWAYIAIAQLIKNGYADRILTTNFDPLMLRACALVNITPGVYDFAASQHFKPAYTSENAIFHLHGQHTGFVLLNTEEEVSRLSEAIAPLFEDAGRNRLWLVAGYSGDNDPVFEQLAKVDSFDQRLYWIGYQENEPSTPVRDRLLSKEKSAFFVKGYDADSFFVTLAQKLGCFPPQWIERPFSYLNQILDSLVSFELPGEKTPLDIRAFTRVIINDAISTLEDGEKGKTLVAEARLLAGEYELVGNTDISGALPPRIRLAAWALTMQGNSFVEKAKTIRPAERDEKYRLAAEKYAAAVAIKPDMHEAFNNWGNALLAQAKGKAGTEADDFFSLAAEKYAAALAIKPDKPEALNNWANAISVQAKGKTGTEADELYRSAAEKYAAALAINPNMAEALNNWGDALADQAKGKSGTEADDLYRLAAEKCAAALAIKPDMAEALNNWGAALADQAKGKAGTEADELYRLAGEKYTAALAITPDMAEAFSNWGSTLADQAKGKDGTEADELYRLAGEKCATALAIKPDMARAFNNWGNALSDQAKGKSGTEADELYRLAGEKYAGALAIKSDLPEPLSNWGAALADQAKSKGGAEADELYRLAGEKCAAALAIKPDMVEAFSNWGNALSDQARRKAGTEADDLYRLAGEKYAAALAIKPDMADAFNNWGAALADQAKSKGGAEADELYRLVGEKYAAAVTIKPNHHGVLNNWGAALMEQGKRKTGAESERLFAEALQKFSLVEQKKPNAALYNLGCYNSLRGNHGDSKSCLEKAKECGVLPEFAHLESDTDLDPVRHHDWFSRLLSNI